MFPPLEAYKGGRTNPAPVISAIQIVMIRHFGFRFMISNMRLDGIDFVVDDLEISIAIQKEKIGPRWCLKMECPSISPVLRRPTNDQLETAIKRFAESIKIALGKLSTSKPRFRVIQGGKK